MRIVTIVSLCLLYLNPGPKVVKDQSEQNMREGITYASETIDDLEIYEKESKFRKNKPYEPRDGDCDELGDKGGILE